ncbi:MAG: hypothetical protein GY794_07220, partial [bacterium]|nr:hypothetical protein [bacterium]
MRKRVLLALGYFSTELYHGITRFAHEAEWILDTTAVRYGRIPSNWRGDGILTYLRQDRSDLLKLVRGFHGPVVDFCSDLPNIKAARVIPDNTAAARLAAEHLLERNYRDLAFLQMTDSYNVRTRESSFRNTCLQAGANYMHWNYSSVSAAKKGSWLKWLCKTLQRAPRPMGVLAQSDNR